MPPFQGIGAVFLERVGVGPDKLGADDVDKRAGVDG
jgi:hypothetical protein